LALHDPVHQCPLGFGPGLAVLQGEVVYVFVEDLSARAPEFDQPCLGSALILPGQEPQLLGRLSRQWSVKQSAKMSCAAIVEVPTLRFDETLPSLLIVVVAGLGLIIHECTPFRQAILA
jgi:hypothetical protein